MSSSAHSPTSAQTGPLGDPVELNSTNGSDPDEVPAAELAIDAATDVVETPHGRSLRHARRARLYGYTLTTAAIAAVVIALAASNTAKTKVSWILGSAHVSLVWMVLAATVLGWLLGLFTAAALHRRTRAPRANRQPLLRPARGLRAYTKRSFK